MKGVVLVVFAVLAYVNAQNRGCGCGCRPSPRPCPRPLPRPLPARTCPAPIEIECPSAPIVTISPVEVPVVGLPSCNCPTIPSLPVSPQILPGIQAAPFINSLGYISPCLGGVPDISLTPLGMINPFLPAASPISALAPTVSSLYPPINPCNCGCNFLKKIPIPPPYI